MKAVIMAGGEGSRLRPLTYSKPKPMLPVANKPLMEHIIELLKSHGLIDIAVTLGYLPDQITNHFRDGRDYGVNIKYYIEKTPLGTAGSIKNTEDYLDSTFLVISGDALTDINLTEAINFHFIKKAVATLVLKQVIRPEGYGITKVNEEGKVIRFLEKPEKGKIFSNIVNTGIYIFSEQIFKYLKKNERMDFGKDIFPMILRKDVPVYGFVTCDYWRDIGNINDYIQCHSDIMDRLVNVCIPGHQVRNKVWIGEGTIIEKNTDLLGPCIIGKNCVIKSDAVIGIYTVIGDLNIIGEKSRIFRSITWNGCNIEVNAQIRRSVRYI